MARSMPDMGGLEPFYGWYTLVTCKAGRTYNLKLTK